MVAKFFCNRRQFTCLENEKNKDLYLSFASTTQMKEFNFRLMHAFKAAN
jgi:hypothetical protein